MAIDFRIYNTDGDLINDERLVAWNVFLMQGEPHILGSTCVIHQDKYLDHIDDWTCDDTYKLWRDYFSEHPMSRDETQLCRLYGHDEIRKLATYLNDDCKETFLRILGDEPAIIVQWW